MQFYRFSISWSRIMPAGDTSDLNEPGLQYYDNLINELLANDIQPMVTMFHWDLPQPIQEIGGMTNPEIIDYFKYYAKVLFNRYGDRVKVWTTFNEPMIICENGYGNPDKAPYVYAPGVGNYLCAYHILLANAEVYQLYQENYKKKYGGKVGIVLNSGFSWPKDPNNPADVEAAERSIEFRLGHYAHPIFSNSGGWPEVMVNAIDRRSKAEGRAWSRLPVLSDAEKEQIKGIIRLFSYKINIEFYLLPLHIGTSDYLGLNYYTSSIQAYKNCTDKPPSFLNDQNVSASVNSKWPRAKSSWLYSVPEGLTAILKYLFTIYWI